MNKENIRRWAGWGILAIVIIALAVCRRSGEAGRDAPETAPPLTLTLAEPVDHLDVLAREPQGEGI